MEPLTNLPPPLPPPPPPPFNPWDPPPPPPPPPFQWGNPGFSGDIFPQFPPFPSPPHHHSFPPKPHFPRKRNFERADDGNIVKLYVGGVPRNVTQEEIYRLFEEHGNVVEVVLLPDKWSGQNQEYCFVKYAFVEEADRAITALHNQFTFPAAMVPLKVKYADAPKRPIGFESVPKVQRLGLEHPLPHEPCVSRSGSMQNDSSYPRQASVGETLYKLYVNNLSREASMQEVEEIFSSYGVVGDIYLMRDESKQSRGCGFVGFTQRHMAVAAINGLHGSYVMNGCDKPLVVRFADPKKPKNAQFRPPNPVDMWGNNMPNPVDMWGNNMPNDLYMVNSSASMQVHNTDIQVGCLAGVSNWSEYPISNEMQNHRISPSNFSQLSLQHSQPSEGSPQSSRQIDSQSQTPFHSNPTKISVTEQQLHRESPQPYGDTGSHSIMPIAEPSCNLSSGLTEDPVDCDWSEHICPDGFKYYFNSSTCESRWEKPEEFVLYEQKLRTKEFQNQNCEESLIPSLEVSSSEEDHQIQVAQDQIKSCDDERPHLAISCAVELNHEQVQAETIVVGGQACVL